MLFLLLIIKVKNPVDYFLVLTAFDLYMRRNRGSIQNRELDFVWSIWEGFVSYRVTCHSSSSACNIITLSSYSWKNPLAGHVIPCPVTQSAF